MAESDRARRAELEALQARTRHLKADAALEESADLPQRRAALKAALSEVEAALPPVEDEVARLEADLAEVRATVAALEEGHRRNEHSSLTVLAVPAALGVPVLALWAFDHFGVPMEAAVVAGGFALPALWLEPVLKWRPPKFQAREAAVGLASLAAVVGAAWLLPLLGNVDHELLRALGSAALALGCVGLVTYELARQPEGPRGMSGFMRMLALIVLGADTLPLARHGGLWSLALGATPALVGFTVSFLEGRLRLWLLSRRDAEAATKSEEADAVAAPQSPSREKVGPP